MSESAVRMHAEVPFSLPSPIINTLEQARIITTKLSAISDRFSMSGVDNTVSHREELDDLSFEVGRIHASLIFDLVRYDEQTGEELSSAELIYFDSLIKNIDNVRGFNFKVPNREVNRFRLLTPGSYVTFIEVGKASGMVLEGVLDDFPVAQLEFDLEENTIDANVSYRFSDHREISKLWSEAAVIKLPGRSFREV